MSSRRLLILGISFILYVLACATPALVLRTGRWDYPQSGQKVWKWEGYETVAGVELLAASVFGLFLLNFAGLANVFFCVSWIMFALRKYPAAVVISAVALLFSMQTFQLIVDPFLFDEAGSKKWYLSSVQIGFLSWVASMACVLAGSLRMQRAAE